MAVEFVRLDSKITDNVEFGTCELCFSTGTLVEEFLVFTDGNEEWSVPTGFWSYGDFMIEYSLVNVVHFGNYINNLKITDVQDFKENFSNYYYDYVDNVQDELFDY